MTCPQCRADADGDLLFCPECGADLGNAQALGDSLSDRDVYPLLAAANLHKIRGEWEAAIQKCVEALRIYPNNVSAHSLMGDIYSQKGDIGEALQWYRMALDLKPDSPSERAKIEKLKAARDQEAARPPSEAILQAHAPEVASTRSLSWVRIAVAAGAACFILLGVIAALTQWAARPSVPPIRPTSPPRPRGFTPALNAPAAKTPQPLVAPPIVLSPEENRANEPTGPPASSQEASLTAALRQSRIENAIGSHVAQAQIDPRISWASIMAEYALPEGVPMQEAAARETARIARAVFDTDPRITGVTVRLFSPGYSPADGGTRDPDFVADLTRAALGSADPEQLPGDQLSALLQNIWWNPRLDVPIR
ncbi:MAG: tetratricopeptide repeat protein [Armatimonadetes bacterium]|nr:tetratricopeptide repeat protein [Armatimonadota bacterium]